MPNEETLNEPVGSSYRAAHSGGDTKQPLVPYLFIFSLCIPVFFHAGPIRLAPFLLVLLALMAPMTIKWLTDKNTKRILPDYLLLLYCVWSALALVISHGIQETIEPIAIILLQTFGSYLLGRMYIRTPHDFRKIVNLQLCIVLLLLPFAILEAVTSVPILIKLFKPLGNVLAESMMPPRMGLRRVQAVFEHPILYGIFVSSCFAMVYYSRKFSFALLLCLIAIAVAVFVSLSTGALLCLMVQIALITWGAILGNVQKKWLYFFIIFMAMYITIDLLSNRTPFEVFVSYLTFNTGSSYNRILIWEYGTAEVYRNPLFGIGLNDWIRPWWMHSGSMDNFWLLQAVRYGLPAFLFLSSAFLVVLFRVGAAKNLSFADRKLRDGFVISIVGIFFAICSVHLWNATFCWLVFLMGASICFTEQRDEKQDESEQQLPQTTNRLGYTRPQRNAKRQAASRRALKASS